MHLVPIGKEHEKEEEVVTSFIKNKRSDFKTGYDCCIVPRLSTAFEGI